jgi:SAM-dependent methyltransferase
MTELRPTRGVRRDAIARLLLADILAMAEADGILDRLRARSPVPFPELCGDLEAALGYDLAQAKRRRMLGLLLGLLALCGRVQEVQGAWRWSGPDGPSPPDPGRDEAAAAADGEYRFLRGCLGAAPAYLRGGQPALDFDEPSAALWEHFLGCEEFCAGRALLLELMALADDGPGTLLDLCHGPGWGLDAVLRRLPGIRVTALDFTETFRAVAAARAERAGRAGHGVRKPCEITWVGPARWRGFGDPLPFPDGSFQAVFFTCGDPYVPRPLRRQVYADIARVLAPGGKLGILTRSSPDARPRRRAPSWRGILALAHDFAESVCRGWEGFAPAGETAEAFAGAGLSGAVPPADGMSVLDGSLWVLRKPAAEEAARIPDAGSRA